MAKGEYFFRTGIPEAEDQITKGTPVSSTPGEEALAYVGLPEEVRGARILDVGAGTSDAVALLLASGADAYGVDSKYKNPTELNSLARISINLLRRHGDFKEAKDEERALQKFFKSFKRDKGRYIAAKASALPFKDNFFDFVYSVRSLCGYLDLDPFAFARSVDECLRVTKPGGKIVLFPFETTPNRFDPEGEKVSQMREQSHRYLGAHLYDKVTSGGSQTLEIKRHPYDRVWFRQRLVIVR